MYKDQFLSLVFLTLLSLRKTHYSLIVFACLCYAERVLKCVPLLRRGVDSDGDKRAGGKVKAVNISYDN